MALTSAQQQSLQQALVTRGGYSDIDAANAAANLGGRADELYREFIGSTPGASTVGGGGANIEDFRGALGEIRGEFEGPLKQQQESLQDRYSAIIDDIKGVGARQEERQRSATSEELARRGISLQGGLGQQQITGATAPIAEQTQRLLKGAGADLSQAMAQLQSGYQANTINAALGLLGLQQGQQQQAALDQASPLAFREYGGLGYALDPFTGQVVQTYGGGGGGGIGGDAGGPINWEAELGDLIAESQGQIYGPSMTGPTATPQSKYGMSTPEGYLNYFF